MLSQPSFSSPLINGPQLVFTLYNRFFCHQACYSLLPAKPGGQADRVISLRKYKVIGLKGWEGGWGKPKEKVLYSSRWMAHPVLCACIFDRGQERLACLSGLLFWVSSCSLVIKNLLVKGCRLISESYSQCKRYNCPWFNPSILRYSGIWGVAYCKLMGKKTNNFLLTDICNSILLDCNCSFIKASPLP